MSVNLGKILSSSEYDCHSFSEKNKEELEKNGFCLIPPKNFFWKWIGADPQEIRNIIDELIKKEGNSAGSEGKEEYTVKKNKKIEQGATRVGNLLNKNKIFSKISSLPEIITAANFVIQDEIKLSSILFRQPDFDTPEQEIHIDWHPRRNKNDKYNAFVAFLYLEDSNKTNGATILIPGSHKRLGYPCEKINPYIKNSEEYLVEAEKGSLLFLNANTWHKGGKNISGKKRGIIVVEYRNRKLKQLLNLKKYIDKKKIKNFNEFEKYLFGLRTQDIFQKEKSFGPGEEYRKWLKKNPKFNYKSN